MNSEAAEAMVAQLMTRASTVNSDKSGSAGLDAALLNFNLDFANLKLDGLSSDDLTASEGTATKGHAPASDTTATTTALSNTRTTNLPLPAAPPVAAARCYWSAADNSLPHPNR